MAGTGGSSRAIPQADVLGSKVAVTVVAPKEWNCEMPTRQQPILTGPEYMELLRLRKRILAIDGALPIADTDWRELSALRVRATELDAAYQIDSLRAQVRALMTDPFAAGLRTAFHYASRTAFEQGCPDLATRLTRLAMELLR